MVDQEVLSARQLLQLNESSPTFLLCGMWITRAKHTHRRTKIESLLSWSNMGLLISNIVCINPLRTRDYIKGDIPIVNFDEDEHRQGEEVEHRQVEEVGQMNDTK